MNPVRKKRSRLKRCSSRLLLQSTLRCITFLVLNGQRLGEAKSGSMNLKGREKSGRKPWMP